MKNITIFLLFVLVCSLSGFLAPYYWFFDLFNHFRPQAFLAGFIILMPAIYFRDKLNIILAALIIIINAALIISRINAFGPAYNISSSNETIQIISINVLTSNTNHNAMIRLAEKYQPDVLVLIEVNGRWIEALKPIEQNYRYVLKHPRADNFGIAVYAKAPFDGSVLDIGKYHLPLARLDFDSYTLLAAHPLPPTQQDYAIELAKYMKHIAVVAAKNDRPMIVAGDFNASLWSNNMMPFIAAGLKPSNRTGLAWTWPAISLPLLAVQIDHIFTRHAEAKTFDVLENTGSDHFPIRAVINIQK